MNKKILSLLATIILLPVTIVSLWGGLILLFILIGDKLDSNTIVLATMFITIIILCFLGLSALWIEMINRLFFSRTLMNKRLVSIPMHVCAVISIISILSLLSMLLVPASKDTTGLLGLLAFGSPALFPYYYLLRTKHANNAKNFGS